MAYTAAYETLPGLTANSTGLAGSQFCFGKLASTAGKVVIGVLNTTTGGTGIYGVIMNKPAANEEVEFAVSGTVKVIAATSTIAIGDRLGVNSTGKVTDAAVTDNVFFVGRAITAASAANDIITVGLVPFGPGRH